MEAFPDWDMQCVFSDEWIAGKNNRFSSTISIFAVQLTIAPGSYCHVKTKRFVKEIFNHHIIQQHQHR
jgi:hypothetical protein